MLSRLSFLDLVASSAVAGPINAHLPARAKAISWSFPGEVAAYAQRLDADVPFVEHNSALKLPSASLIKLLIYLESARRVQASGGSWNQKIAITANDVVEGSDTFGNARSGQTATIASLARAMITQSDNTAANVLARSCTFSQINRLASALDLRQLSLRRYFMDFASRKRGIENLCSARDLGVLLRGVSLGTQNGYGGVTPTNCARLISLMLQQEDRETIPRALGNGVKIANKTGELDDVRGDAALVRAGSSNAYVMVLLGADISNRALAFHRLILLALEINAIA